MSTTHESSDAFHLGTTAIFSLLSPDQIRQLAELQGDPAIVARLEALANKANEGELTEEERDAYEGYIEANNLLAMLQAEARFRLAQGER